MYEAVRSPWSNSVRVIIWIEEEMEITVGVVVVMDIGPSKHRKYLSTTADNSKYRSVLLQS